MDSDWSVNDPGGIGPDLGSSLRTPGAVRRMAEDAIEEADRPEQEREYEQFEAEQARERDTRGEG